jgi:hypothetical protein
LSHADCKLGNRFCALFRSSTFIPIASLSERDLS